MDARETALLALDECRRQGGWSDGILKKHLAKAGLDRRDSALCTQLCFGVLQNRMLLDFYLSHFSRLPLKRLESKILQSLRLGAYQMLFLDKIPHSAAVNSAVELARAYSRNARAPGMVNGVLRSLARGLEKLPEIPREDFTEYLSLRYSHPAWLVKEFILTLGEGEAEALLAANNTQPPVTAQVNTLRTTAAALEERLRREGVEAGPHPWLADCLVLGGTGRVEELSAFREGLFYIQDAASRLAAAAAGAAPGMRVLDACAAPGGKSFAAAIQMADRGEVVSCDLHPHKKRLMDAGRERLGLTCIRTGTSDAARFDPAQEGAFDLVIADVPCSGLGVIRKKPDIRYKDPAPLEGLPQVQGRILDNVSRYVKPGGTLLYSTCTVLDRENGQVVRAFLEVHPEYEPEPFQLPEPAGAAEEGMLTLWSHRHGTDGFFFARLRRRT